MRIACIIMAHKEPLQIERFIKKFDSNYFDFYLHVDRKAALEPFLFLKKSPGVHFVNSRMVVRWASSNYFFAVIESLKEALASGIHYEFFSIMSGQDYPIKPVNHFYQNLKQNTARNFISYEDDGKWWEHAINRIKKYDFTNFGFRGKYRLQFLVNSIMPDRKFPLPYTLYGGPRAMCMTLSREAVIYTTQFIDRNIKLKRFIRFTWGPDEFIIPTLLMNSSFRNSVINENFYYIDWSKNDINPKTFTVTDFERLRQTGKLLARKFDINLDSGILDLMDQLNESLG